MSGEMNENKCDVCNAEPVAGVAAVPGVPISVGYGRKCLEANAHPYWVLLANTATIVVDPQHWREQTAEWWQQMVDDSLKHLGKTEAEFKTDLIKDIEDYERYHEETHESGQG